MRAGRVAKGSRVPNLWTVTSTDPVKSLATAAHSATILSQRFRPSSRFAVASREEPGRGAAGGEGSEEPVQYGQGVSQGCSSRRRQSVPAPEEEEEGDSSGEEEGVEDLSVDESGSEEEGSGASATSDCADVRSRAKVFRTLLASSRAGCPAPSDQGVSAVLSWECGPVVVSAKTW